MLKSSSGLHNEIKYSLTFHADGIPLLVSPQLLRHRQLGQLDLSRLIKEGRDWIIEIGEVKSSVIGELQMERSQKFRLLDAQCFLSALFGFRSKLTRLIG